MTRKKVKFIFIFILVIVLILKIIPMLILFNGDEAKLNFISKNKTEKTGISISNILDYDMGDLIEYIELSTNEVNILEEEPDAVYCLEGNSYNVNIDINKENLDENYILQWGIGDNLEEKIISDSEKISFNFNEEGKNTCIINVLKGETIVASWKKEISYIKPYKKQFLDEISNHGICIDQNVEYEYLKALGIKDIRMDIRWTVIEKNGYEIYDKMIEELTKLDINIYVIFGGVSTKQLR